MKLKEIKPGMVIHCKTEKEVNAVPLLDGLGKKLTYVEAPCYLYIDTFYGIAYVSAWDKEENGVDKIKLLEEDYRLLEFSDLIIPEYELSTEEVWEVIRKDEFAEWYCNRYDGRLVDRPYSEAAEICKEWESLSQKKKPEVEMIDVCNVYKENKGKGFDFIASIKMPNNPYSEKDEVKRILEDYGKGHIAKIESMFRVKER